MPSLQDELKNKIIKSSLKKSEGNKDNYIDSQKRAKKREPIVQLNKKKYSNEHAKVKCEYCNKSFRKEILNAHHREVHAEEIKTKKSKYIKCSKCNTKILSSLMSKHMQEKHGNKVKIIDPSSKDNIAKKDILHLPFSQNIKFTLSNYEHYKDPEPWFNESDEVNISGTSVNIYIGLDFGTSYTKAVIYFGGDSYIVNWEGISNFSRYMLPSEFSILENNNFKIGNSSEKKEVFNNLKVPLIEGNADQKQEKNVTIYLSLVLKYIRKWWHRNKPSNTENVTFIWHINIGLPAKINNDEKILKQYNKITKDAWIESYNKSVENGNQNIEINCFSEFQAQVQTYLKHPQRQNDLHLLCDIGAGTVDIVGFNIHQDEEYDSTLPEFASQVEKIGTHYLLNLRYQSDDKNNKLESSKRIYDASKLLTGEEFSEEYKIDPKLINNADQIYLEELSKLIIQVLGKMKVRRYQNSPSWNNELRCFLCGGAVNTKIIKSVFNKVKSTYDCLKPIPFPIPNNIQTVEIESNDFQRISVAYGLACDPFNMPKIKNANKDWKPPSLPMRENLGGNYDK